MTHSSAKSAAVPLALALSAGVACAEPAGPADPLMSRLQPKSAVAAAQPAASQAYGPSLQSRLDGVVQTSVEKRFGVRDGTVGEAGFLCGLLPHPDTSGAAAAFGHDPDGRFVGAKLSLSF